WLCLALSLKTRHPTTDPIGRPCLEPFLQQWYIKNRRMVSRRFVAWLLTLVLVLQSLPAGAVMVGCTMGAKQAACSKWADPARQACCCKSAPTPGMACCVQSKAHLLRAASRDGGCKCDFVLKASPGPASKQSASLLT